MGRRQLEDYTAPVSNEYIPVERRGISDKYLICCRCKKVFDMTKESDGFSRRICNRCYFIVISEEDRKQQSAKKRGRKK